MKKTIFMFACIALIITSLSCESNKMLNPKLKTENLILNGKKLVTELAISAKERELGLMNRTSLKDGEAMLFVFESDQKLTFWMKNTLIPLSVAYISKDGSILEIYDMVKESLAPVPSEHYVRYALEVPQGYFSRIGAKVGDRVTLPNISTAKE